MEGNGFTNQRLLINSSNVIYTDNEVISSYTYNDARVRENKVIPTSERLVFKTELFVPKTGVLLVG